MWEEVKEMDIACEEAACACDEIMPQLDALDDFSITPEDDRPESEGGIPPEITFDGSEDGGDGLDDFSDPDFDNLTDYEGMY